ncbi:pyridine nucleotide-disulfide oxidoreductase [Sphingobium terrigena]|uniref:Pyridine nucleotide-disulfide oxidoreductase n=1 Tax=Sphingobium terrigena TaxID=2304063 RepID=A0A418YL70_9SPHN|nr:FAD-dependent oxidoreductase [Sphingobium terrigena]RJG51735.1 pyridine nucleotide-disulfide oxidoreductase [Sphingobium terrigena]
MSAVGAHDADRRYHVAIVGAGPAGFYAAEALLQASEGVAVDLYDRLPTPYGLVRYGVAPDHPKLKQVITVFRAIAAMAGFRFLGNVTVGRDVSVEDLRRHYHAVIIACGAERDRVLDIPGADLKGVHGGMAFVGWYNGHPYRRSLAPDLSGKTAVVLGLGNVALDVVRILAKPSDALARTDIAAHALETLAASGIERIVVAGRSGPAQARCTEKELREFGTIPGCVTTAEPGHFAASPERGVAAIFSGFPAADAAMGSRHCHFAFGLQPIAILGNDRVSGVRFARSPISEGLPLLGAEVEVDVEADIVIACIGSRATLLPGLPYVGGESFVRNEAGRICDAQGWVPALYAAGWIKRGASGTIGTNRADAVETVGHLLADLPSLPEPTSSVHLLTGAGTSIGRSSISFAQWENIDRAEILGGANHAKPREKITDIAAMILNAGE